jgi:predicted PurR-regulated permease PerM
MMNLDEKKKKLLTIGIGVYALLIFLFIFIVNFDKFSTWIQWINDKLNVFTPIIIGAIIAYLCVPLVKFFQNKIFKKMKNKKARRVLSIVFTYITLFGVIIAFVALIIPQLLSSVEEFFQKMTDGTYLNAAIETVNDFINKLSKNGNGQMGFVDKQKVIQYIRTFFNNSGEIFKQVGNFVLAYASNFVVSLKNVFLGLLLSVYFIIFKERLFAQAKKFFRSILSDKKFESLSGWSVYANSTFGGFIVGKLLDAIFMMIMCSIVFGIARIPYPILIAVVIGISNLIPFFGPFIGAIPSGFIVLISSDISTLILFVVLLLIIQQFDANVVEPKIVGDKTGLTALGVICAVLIMSGYFGILGMFFGVPIFALVSSLFHSSVDVKLRNKQLSTDIGDYYPEDSLAEPIENKEKSGGLFRFIGNIFVFIWKKIKRFFVLRSEKSKQRKSKEDKDDKGE